MNEKIAEVDGNLSKMIQASGVITGDADWNNYTSTGVYKVQNANMTAENHAPVGIYRYGVLQVLVSEIGDEKRMIQIYYPETSSAAVIMVVRLRNNNIWEKWKAISGTALE